MIIEKQNLDPNNNKIIDNKKVDIAIDNNKKNSTNLENIIKNNNTIEKVEKDLACQIEEKDISKSYYSRRLQSIFTYR